MHYNKISVLIPTKDRRDYLFHTLKTCLNQEYSNLDIIVLDDGSTDGSIEMVQGLMVNETRLSAVNNVKNIGMMENFEAGLNRVTEGYVIILGGDDGMLPYSFAKINELINETDASLITWPGATFTYAGVKSDTSQVSISIETRDFSDSYKWVSSDEYLERQCKNLFYPGDIETPMIYVKGVASIEIIREVKDKSPNGRFYNCSTPDGYSGIVLAGHVSKFLFYLRPLSIYGNSPTSTGLAYTRNDEKSKKIAKQFFESVSKVKMHKLLGMENYSPLMSIMTADFLLTAKDINNSTYTVDIKNVIEKGLRELQFGTFSEANISREIKIIKRIAEQHGMEDFFHSRAHNLKRNYKYPFTGNGLGPKQIFIKSTNLGVQNVYDSSYYVFYLLNSLSSFGTRTVLQTIKNSLTYKFSALRKSRRLSTYVANS